jgi:hypothetical protein
VDFLLEAEVRNPPGSISSPFAGDVWRSTVFSGDCSEDRYLYDDTRASRRAGLVLETRGRHTEIFSPKEEWP